MTCNNCGQDMEPDLFSCPSCFTWVNVEPLPADAIQNEIATIEEDDTISDAIAKASDQEIMFVKQLLSNGGNCRAAAIAAGYGHGTAVGHSHRWVRVTREESSKPHLWDIFQYEKHRCLDRLDINENSILLEIARLAFFDPIKMFDRNGNILPLEQMDEDTRRAIGGLDVGSRLDEEGLMERVLKIKISEKRASLDLLTKVLGMQQLNVNVKHGFGAMMEEIMQEDQPLVEEADFEEIDDA